MSLSTVKSARERLLGETPLARDCGMLCNAACCQGDEKTGMLLFPDEEELYKECTFGHVLVLDYAVGRMPAKIFVCEGTCPRDERPLACRLFPLFLRFYRDQSRVCMDPRALMCPLLEFGVQGLRQSFVETVREVYNTLMQDEDCADFLHGLNDILSL